MMSILFILRMQSVNVVIRMALQVGLVLTYNFNSRIFTEILTHDYIHNCLNDPYHVWRQNSQRGVRN